MEKKNKKKKWATLGTLRKNKSGGFYLVIDPSIRIQVGKFNPETKQVEGYQTLDLSKFRTANVRKIEEVIGSMVDNKILTEEQGEEKLNQALEKNIKYEIAIPPSE